MCNELVNVSSYNRKLEIAIGEDFALVDTSVICTAIRPDPKRFAELAHRARRVGV
jgi:hypothetical protein